MNELILHHYDFSPFSEKIRIAFGLKGLAWRSVEIPAYLPKPDVVALTGGYRLTPVLQIGAEVFCDTRVIARELDRRFPARPLLEPSRAGLTAAVEAWAERDVFWPVVRYVSGMNTEALGPELHKDRAAMRGKSTAPPPAKIRAAGERSLGLVRACVLKIANMLRSSPYLVSDRPGLADLAVYHALWFLSALPVDCAPAVLDGYPDIQSWMSRIAAIGHGQRSAMSSAEALVIATKATPSPPRASDPAPFDPPLGSRLSIRPEDYVTEETVGELVFIDADDLAVKRTDAVLGDLVVYFPRVGYAIRTH